MDDDVSEAIPAHVLGGPRVLRPVVGTSKHLLARVTNVVRLLRGGLDATHYERYLEEHRVHGNGDEPLSESAFWQQRARGARASVRRIAA